MNKTEAMMDALRQQRDMNANQVVELVGTIAEKDAEIASLKQLLEEAMKKQSTQ